MNKTNIQWTDFTSNPIRYKNADGHGGGMAEWPEDLRIREWPAVRS